MQRKSLGRLGLVALLTGATAIGFAPIFVRWSEVGPSATAFYRVLIALPFLCLAARLEPASAVSLLSGRGRGATTSGLSSNPGPFWRRPLVWCVAAGCLFAGDMAFWHWSIRMTSVANSTLLTNCAPFFVVLGARVVFREPITAALMLGMLVASAGAAMLVGASFQLTPQHLIGDALALITAAFYGGYLLTIKHLRRDFSTARILACSGLVSCAALLAVAVLSQEQIQVRSGRGWLVLLALGIVSHLGGQGLIAYALAHLPAGFSSVGLLLQPVVADVLAWLLLAEPLTPLQAMGGSVILLGIVIASRTTRRPPARHP